MKIKSGISFLVIICILFSLSVMASADNVSQIIGNGNVVVFVDVPNNHWAKEQIDYFSQQGIVSGFGDGSFKPDAGVTREQFCKMLVETFKAPHVLPDYPSFSDVAQDRWSFSYVETCREFLTGYANPFGGMPTFHPAEYATREDIAVALVRMMGFTGDDALNESYAQWSFRDGDKISPSLLPYVSVACEKGLITGYPDGTFGPEKGITRAETVVLLNRATKQAVTDINAELEIAAQVLYSQDGKTATVNIVAEEGTTVTVNGENVKMSSNYYGEYEGNYVYKFEEEGSKDFIVEGKKAGKSKRVNVTAKYEIGAPILTINQQNQTVTDKDFTLRGTAKDDNYEVTLTINGKSVPVQWDAWSQSYVLEEGANTFEVVATNECGKTTKKIVTITYEVGAPKLTISQQNQTVTDKNFTLRGTAKDDNYEVTLTINGKSVPVQWDSWSQSYVLEEGANTFEVVATNENGKQTKKSVTITYEVGAPKLTISQQNQTVTDKNFTLRGTAKDDNYEVTLTINGKSVPVQWDSWSQSYVLEEGANTFEVVATNENGKQTKKSVTVTYEVGAPKLTISQQNQTVTDKNFTLRGTAKDDNYEVTLTINGKSVPVQWGSWSQSYILEEGENTFEVIATNEWGKQTKKSVTIIYEVE